MKINTKILPLFTVSAGIVGMIFRFWLEAAGTDAEGLIIPNHPSVPLMFILTALTFAVLGLCAFSAGKQAKPFSSSIVGAIGCFFAAIGVIVTGFLEMVASRELLVSICFVFSLVAGLGLAWMGLCRASKQPCNLWIHVIVVIYFILHLVLQYRTWSALPQLQQYFFPLLSSAFLLVGVYQRACKDLNQPGEGLYVFFNQAALFCCFLSVVGPAWPFYSAMILWISLDTFPVKEA